MRLFFRSLVALRGFTVAFVVTAALVSPAMAQTSSLVVNNRNVTPLKIFLESVEAAEGFTLDNYSRPAWKGLARLSHEAVKREIAKYGWTAVRNTLRNEGFLPFVEAENQRLVEAICAMPDRTCVYDDALGALREEGEALTVSVIDEIVEMRRILAVIDYDLREAADEWSFGRFAFFNRTDALDIEEAIVAALRREQEALKARAIAFALDLLPQELRVLLSTDTEAVLQHYAAAKSAEVEGALDRLNEVGEGAEAAAARAALEEVEAARDTLRRANAALVESIEPLRTEATRIKARVNAVEDALRGYLCHDPVHALSGQDLERPHLALRRDPSNDEAPAGLVLVVPLSELAETLPDAVRPGCGPRSEHSARALIDLGVALPRLAYDLEAQRYYVDAALNRTWEHAARGIDDRRAALEKTLKDLGIPIFATPRNIEFTIEDLFAPERTVVFAFDMPISIGPAQTETVRVGFSLTDGLMLDASRCAFIDAVRDTLIPGLEARLSSLGRAVDFGEGVALRSLEAQELNGCATLVAVDGVLAIDALDVEVPVSLRLDEAGRLRPAAPLFLGALKEALRKKASDSIVTAVAAVQTLANQIDERIRVTDLTLDPYPLFDRGVFSATGTATLVVAEADDLAIGFAWSSDQGFTIDAGIALESFKDLVRTKIEASVAPLLTEAEALKADFEAGANELLNALRTAEFDLFGVTAKLVVPANLSLSDEMRVGAVLTLPRRDIAVEMTGLTLIAPKLEGGRISAGAIRFSADTKFVGNVKMLDVIAELTGLDPEWLTLTQERFVGNSYTADLAISVDGIFAAPVSLGAITISAKGIDAEFNNNLRFTIAREVEARLTDAAASLVEQVGTLGPVEDIALKVCENGSRADCTFIDVEARQLAVWVSGTLLVDAFDNELRMPFTAQLFNQDGPSFRLKVDEDALRGTVTERISQVLSALGPNPDSFVINRLLIDEPPYGIEVSFAFGIPDLGVADGLSLKVDRLQITQNGMRTNGPVAFRVPADIPLGPVSILKPGLEVDLLEPTIIAMVGDTALDPATVNVVKIASRVGVDLKEIAVGVEGRMIVANTLPILRAKGKLSLGKAPEAKLDAETEAVIKKILDARAEVLVSGNDGSVSGDARLAVLGLDIGDTRFFFRVDPAQFSASGETRIPIGSNIRFDIEGGPGLSPVSGAASASLDFGSFRAVNVGLALEPGRAVGNFGVLGLNAKIIAPLVSDISERMVIDLLKSLFKVDISAFLNALKNREIVLNLIDPGGNPSDGTIGDGDPVDGGAETAAAPSEAANAGADAGVTLADAPANEARDQAIPPGATEVQAEGEPADTSEDPAAPEHPRPRPAGGDSEETVVYADEDSGWRVTWVEAPGAPGHFIRQLSWEGRYVFNSSEFYTAAARAAMVEGPIWMRFYGLRGKASPYPCSVSSDDFLLRPDRPMHYRPIHLALEPGSPVRLKAIEGGYNAPAPRIVDEFPFPFYDVGLSAAKLLDRETRLYPADRRLIRMSVRTALSCAYGTRPTIRFLKLGGAPENDAYVVRRDDEAGRKLVELMTREGTTISLSDASPLFGAMAEGSGHSIERLLIESSQNGKRLDLVWADEANQRFLLLERGGGSNALIAAFPDKTLRATAERLKDNRARNGLDRELYAEDDEKEILAFMTDQLETAGDGEHHLFFPKDETDPNGSTYRTIGLTTNVTNDDWSATLGIVRGNDLRAAKAAGTAIEQEVTAAQSDCGQKQHFAAGTAAPSARLDMMRAALGERSVWEDRFKLCRSPRVLFQLL